MSAESANADGEAEREADVAPSASLKKVERWMPWAAGAAFALLTLIPRYLPMTDLPLHEGAVGLLRHFGDESYMPRDLYVRNFGHPNQLFHVTALLLSYVFSTSKAVQIVVAAAQIGIFTGGARFADYLGRSRWSVLLLTPLALGFTYYWGLVANLIGYALFLYLLPVLDRGSVEPTLKRVGQQVAALVLLFFAHESIFICSAGILGLFALLEPLSRKTLLRFVPVVFGGVAVFAHQIWQAQFITRGQAPIPTTYLTFGRKLELLPNALFGSHDAIMRLVLLLLCLLAMGLFGAARWREDRAASREESTAGRLARIQALLCRHRFEVAGLVHLVAYMTVPFTWHGATMIHERFLGPAWALLVLTLVPRGDVPRIGRLVAIVIPVADLLVSWPQFQDAHVVYSDLDKIIEHIPKNATVTQASADRSPYHTRVYSAATAPARVVADRGGRIGLALVFSPISPIQIRRPYLWDEYNFRIAYNGSMTMKPPHDLRHWEWVVGHSRDPEIRRLLVDVLRPEADLVTEKGEWLLFHSKLPLGSMLDPGDVSPDDMPTVWDRLRWAEKELKKKKDGETTKPVEITPNKE